MAGSTAVADSPAVAESITAADSPVMAETTTMADPPSVAESPAEPAGDTLQPRGLPFGRAPKPVFVDASGGRRRRLRILVAAAVTPAVAYVALLVSTLLGGPTLPALLPHAVRPKPSTVAAPAHQGHRAGLSRTAAAGAVALQRGSERARAVSKAGDHASATAKALPTATLPPGATPSPSAKPSATAQASPSGTPSPSRSPHPKPSHRPHPTAEPSVPPTHGGLSLT
ncbi:hypothetical protein AB5J72_41855 [Streptomyces sp. CG1]|uniref:hypothetical protein n=1 Tax=Streptomyces sp. CG1 TaxID=1287523 RepID=UPI0034E1D691